MAERIVHIRLLIASPSDVTLERQAVEEVIHEQNSIWQRMGVHVDPVRWETDAFPGIGTDAQSVISAQLGRDHDIVLGILWTRFGTPTGRGDSGTEEEFNEAVKRYHEDPRSVRILMYFKDAPPASLSSIDPLQLRKVQEFKSRIEGRGVFTWSFQDAEELHNLVQVHLSKQLYDWKNGWSRADQDETSERGATTVIEQADDDKGIEEGFLDLIERGVDAFENLTEVSTRIADASVALNRRLEARNLEMREWSTSGGDIGSAQRLLIRLATNMHSYESALRAELPLYEKGYKEAMEAWAQAASLYRSDFVSSEEDMSQLEDALSTVRDLKQALVSLQDTLTKLRTQINGIPRASTALNRAKRATAQVLRDFVGRTKQAVSLTAEIETTFVELMGGDQ